MLALSGAALIVAFGCCWISLPVRFYLRSRWFPDDAFYYFQVARNVVAGHGFTFDQLNETNGFQPLWMGVCIAVHWIIRDRVHFLHAINGVEVALAALSFVLLYLSCTTISRSPLASFLSLITLFGVAHFYMSIVNGLETGIHVCCLSATVLALLNVERRNADARSASLLGVALTATFFARLDSGLLCVLAGVYLLSRRPTGTALVYFAAPFVLLAAPYLIYNKVAFGFFTPISGEVKKIWGAIAFQGRLESGASLGSVLLEGLTWPRTAAYPTNQVGLLVVINFIIGVTYAVARRWAMVAVQAYFVLKFFVYVWMFHVFACFSWYYVVDFIGPALFLPYVIGRVASLRPVSMLVEAAKWPALGIAGYILFGLAQTDSQSAYAFAAHQRSVFKPHDVMNNELEVYYAMAGILNKMHIDRETIFAAHNSGVMGYFLKYRMVNVDGLINGTKRLDYIRKYGWEFMHYLDEGQHIDAYAESLAVGAKPDLDQAFVKERGFEEIPISQMIEEQYGKSEFTTAVTYIRPGKWKR